MYATAPIPYDGLIIREYPLFIINVYEKSKISKEDISNALLKLSEEERETVSGSFRI